MSALSSICGYSSHSEESDAETQESLAKRPRLPVPDLSFVSSLEEDIPKDLPDLHGGRIRSFAHVRGNWPTFVYVKYNQETDEIVKTVKKLQGIVCSSGQEWHICDDFHISLSKTVVLKYHWISTFNKSLQKIFEEFPSFYINFGRVKVYSNEENTRTFIALEVDFFFHKILTDICNKVNELLAEFKLPTFYEKPSFHMSVLWANGNKETDVIDLNKFLNQDQLETVRIDKVFCKTGNKIFQYSLT